MPRTRPVPSSISPARNGWIGVSDDDDRVGRRRRLARASLAISVLLGAVGGGYFWLAGDLVMAAVVATLLPLAGYWEYTRKLHDIRENARSSAE